MIGVERAPAARAGEAAQRLARTHEHRVMAAAHPVAWRLSRLATRFDPDLCFAPGFGYVVSGAEMLREILVDPRRFRKDGSASVGAIATQVFGETAFINMEGPSHAELRRTLQAIFAPAAVDASVGRHGAPLFDSLRERLLAGEIVDLAHFSKIAAATAVVGALLPNSGPHLEARALALHDAATRLAGLLSLRLRRLSAAELTEARALTDDMLRGPASSSDDGVTGLLRGAGMDASSVRGVTAMLMVAGMETTSVALARVTALLSDTGWWPRVDSDSATSVLDEALRYVSPLPGMTRTVAEDCEIHGRLFRRGRTLVGHIYNAVRDARVIERGNDFDPDRAIPTSLRQLWFGAGTHFCIGMPLARAVLTTTISGLAELGGVEVVARQPAARVLIPAYARLLVRRSSPPRETT